MPDRLPLSTIVDPAIRERELAAVASVLAHPFTQADMDQWISAGRDRYNVFRDTFWGNIRWSKSIGRSAGASLADGFAFALEDHFASYGFGSDGIPVTTGEGLHQLPAPSAWDADDDADHYRVVYFGYYTQYNGFVDRNELKVTIAGTWTNPTHLPRYLLPSPLGFVFGSFDGSPIVLDDMTVEQHTLEPVPRWVMQL